MNLFGKKENIKECCIRNNGASESNDANLYTKENGIKVLGSGCKKCKELEKNVIEALQELGIDETVEHVTDFAQIAAYGVISTPALVVDDKVVSFGKVLTKDEAKTFLKAR